MTDDAPVTDAPVTEEPDTRRLDDLLEDIYHGQERISQADIYRRAVAAELPAQLLTRIAALPEGEYAVDEVADLLGGVHLTRAWTASWTADRPEADDTDEATTSDENHAREGAGARSAPGGRDTLPEPDFANEHDRTAVDRDIITGADADEREPESPHGWAGRQR